jgi:hypothetical protein
MAKKYQGFIDLPENKIIKDQSLIKYEAIKKDILILPELKSLIPPLNTDEFSQLEENIKPLRIMLRILMNWSLC